tara:strand:- start:174 stop:968 length:795 start_codon:yes stop_codon:yes gene_type:complete
MIRALFFAVLAILSIANTTHADTTSHAISGIQLGMPRDEALAILKGLKAEADKVNKTPARLSRYSAKTADLTSDFVVAESLKIVISEYSDRGFNAEDRIAVVYSEFNDNRVVAVFRHQKYAKQKVSAETIANAVKDTYGIVVDKKDGWKPYSIHGLSMTNKAGNPTTDAKCAESTKDNHPASGKSLLIEGFSIWSVHFPHCGQLLKVTMHKAGKTGYLEGLTQQMIDTQAVLGDGEIANAIRLSTEKAAKDAELAKAKKVAPKL